MSRRLFFVVTLAVLTGLVGPIAAVPAPGAPKAGAKAMVLSLSDLPSKYGLTDGHYVSNTELNHKNPPWKNYRKLGRITGYNASYTTIAVAGLTHVDSFASIYKTGAGAHNSLMLTLMQADEDGTKLLATQPGLLGGDVLVYRMKANGSTVDRYTVAWRRGSVFAEVIGGGVAGRVDVADVVALAKKQDSRIAKALQLS
jgi:hypothetical protein